MNKVFNSKAYLKMSIIERPQQEIVDKLTEELKLAKEKYGKKSDEELGIIYYNFKYRKESIKNYMAV